MKRSGSLFGNVDQIDFIVAMTTENSKNMYGSFIIKHTKSIFLLLDSLKTEGKLGGELWTV